MTSIECMKAWLTDHGYIYGDRDPRLNTNFPGRFMITEIDFESGKLPTQDAANGPYCIVGDDLDALIADAYRFLRDDEFPAMPP